jgi:probable phosphoglycerate mutase
MDGEMARDPILYVARHGETDWNAAGRWQGQTDVPLNAKGREQALAIAERLRGEGIAAIASSDLLRARETARIVAVALGLEVGHLDANLRERGFGCFEGLTREEVAARFPGEWARYLADPGPAPPGGESREALLSRLLPAVLAAAERLAPPPLLVMHGGAMRALLADHMASIPRPGSAAWPLHGIQNGHVYRVTLADGRIAAAERVGDRPDGA